MLNSTLFQHLEQVARRFALNLMSLKLVSVDTAETYQATCVQLTFWTSLEI